MFDFEAEIEENCVNRPTCAETKQLSFTQSERIHHAGRKTFEPPDPTKKGLGGKIPSKFVLSLPSTVPIPTHTGEKARERVGLANPTWAGI